MEMIEYLIGTEDRILWWQMIVRTTIIFFIALILVRFGGKRIFGKHTAFDIVLGIVLGSILGRAITGGAPFLTSMVAAFTLVLLHMMIAMTSYRWDFIGGLVKGNFQLLVKDGEIQWDNMKRNSISERDLEESMRMQGKNGVDIADIKTAYFERSGDISIQLKKQ